MISAVALIAILLLVDLKQLVEALRLADYRLVLLGIAISVTWVAVRGMVWRTLLQEKASYSQVFFSVNEGYLLNNLLPFRLGEVGRCLLLSQKAGLDFWQVFSTVIIERILDLALAAGLLLSTLPFVIGADWALEAALGVGGVVLLILAALYLLARFREWALLQFQHLGKRAPYPGETGATATDFFSERSGGPDQFLALLTRRFLDGAQLGYCHHAILYFHAGLFPPYAVALGSFLTGSAGIRHRCSILSRIDWSDGAFHHRRAGSVWIGFIHRPGVCPDRPPEQLPDIGRPGFLCIGTRWGNVSRTVPASAENLQH